MREMRKFKVYIFTALAVITLFSIRDKEVVLHVPDNKPLVAEAYSDSNSITSQTGPEQSVAPSKQDITSSTSPSNNSSDYSYPNTSDNSGNNCS